MGTIDLKLIGILYGVFGSQSILEPYAGFQMMPGDGPPSLCHRTHFPPSALLRMRHSEFHGSHILVMIVSIEIDLD